MISFRNIIVYEYSKIELQRVYDILKRGLADITKILNEIISYAKLQI